MMESHCFVATIIEMLQRHFSKYEATKKTFAREKRLYVCCSGRHCSVIVNIDCLLRGLNTLARFSTICTTEINYVISCLLSCPPKKLLKVVSTFNPFNPGGLFYLKSLVMSISGIRGVLFVLRFYGPVNPMGSCRTRSVYLTTRLLGRLSPLSG